MKATRHNGRSGKHGSYNPKHNDRQFDISHSEHIDGELALQNVYWDCYGGRRTSAETPENDESFEEVELRFYHDNYQDFVNGQNYRNECNGHSERNRSVEEIYRNKKTCPEESILQLGNIDGSASAETLMNVAETFFEQFSERFGEHVHILDWALHVDEKTPHIHERHVFDLLFFQGSKKEQEEQIKRDCCFPSRIQHEWTFENDNGRNSKMQVAKNYVANWNDMKKNGLGLLLWGSVGSGKSYMAACVANELIKQGADVKMTNFATVLNDLFNCEDKNEYIRSLCRYSLLILDDLGIERNTEYSLENLFNVIDARYVSGKAMIITTNLHLNELMNQKQLSLKQIYDRVLERSIPVCVSENDIRKEKREEAKVKFGKIINGGKMDEEK